MTGICGERLREFRVCRLRVHALLAGAAEVDLDRVKPPRCERLGVLPVVTQRTHTLAIAAAGACIGVDPREQAPLVKPSGQPRQAMRPLLRVDDEFGVAVSLSAGPSEVKPHDLVASLR